tara:strand:- start:481 stop:936 length:456 start_codon:yes stop_codon:yes gene_type:complete
MLSNYKGTLLIVSHDRDFLDQTVNKILYFEGNGKISFYFGGYSDFLNNKKEITNSTIKTKKILDKKKSKPKNKLSYKYKYELESIPKEITNLQEKIIKMKNELKDSNLYLNDNDRFNFIVNELSKMETDLENKESRWLELMEIEEEIKNNE